MIEKNNIVAIQPGYTIKEQLEDRGITQKEFAMRMEMSEKHISRLINGEVLLTTDTAIRLEMVLGISAQFWLNLETIYREKLAKIDLENNLEDDLKLLSNFHYSEIAKNGWIEKTKSKKEKVLNLRKFFEVNRLGLLIENKNLNVFCRRMGENEKANFSLLAWCQKAKLEARKINTKSINIQRLQRIFASIRSMTMQNPKSFCSKLIEDLANNGIALVFLPHINGSFLHGATFYDGNKIVMGLSARGKDADKFWFSFFHEIGHIVLKHIDEDYNESMEEEADAFARDILIPFSEYEKFVSKQIFTQKAIIDFSNSINIDCGIVVGRLQKDNYIPYSKFHYLKKQYQIIN